MMPDREQVIEALHCRAYDDDFPCWKCAYYKQDEKPVARCDYRGLMDDAIALLKEQDEEIENLKQTAQSMMEGVCLLKEQEAVEPIPPTDESDLWKCGNCNHQLFRCTHQKYCEMCGKPVKWK